MKRILLLVLALFISGCISQKDAKNPTQGETSMAFTKNLTWADKELVSDTKMNTMTGNDDWCYDELQVRVRTGPNGSGNTVLSSGIKSGELLSGDASNDITINFDTDSDMGDPSYDGSIRVLVSIEPISGYERIIAQVKNIDEGGFTVHILPLETDHDEGSFKIHWIAIGEND